MLAVPCAHTVRHMAAGVPLAPPLALTMHYEPSSDALQGFGRGLAFLLLAVLGVTGFLALVGGLVSQGQGSAFGGEQSICNLSERFVRPVGLEPGLFHSVLRRTT